MKKRIVSCMIGTMLVASLAVGCGNGSASGTEHGANTQQIESENKTESESGIVSESEMISEVVESEVVESEAAESEAAKSEEVSKSEEESESQVVVGSESEESEESEVVSESESDEKSEVESEKVVYTYKELDRVMYAKGSVNVRSLPSTDGNRVGKLYKNDEVKVTGQCNETSWYRIEYKGSVGYVSDSYLVAERVVEEEKPQEQKPNSSQVEIEKNENSSQKEEISSSKEEISSEKDNNSNSESTKVENEKNENSSSKNDGANEEYIEDMPAGQKAVVEAGYYNVIANSEGGYSVMVKCDEFEKGKKLIYDYLANMGYKHKGCYGNNINVSRDQYIVFCREVVEMSAEDIRNWNGEGYRWIDEGGFSIKVRVDKYGNIMYNEDGSYVELGRIEI